MKQPAYPVANSQIVKSKYMSYAFLQPVASNAIQTLTFRGNDIYRPGFSIADTNTALPYQEWKDFYKNYYVYGSKIQVIVNNVSAETGGVKPRFYCSLTANPSAAFTAADLNSIMVSTLRPNTIVKYINTPSIGGHAKFSMFMKTSKMFGVDTSKEDNYEGDFVNSTPPVDQFFYSINIGHPTGQTLYFDYRVKIIYYLMLRTRRTFFEDD